MLKRALELRDKEEKYEEAGICLLKAAEEENNPEAMFYLYFAYRDGGWGLEKNSNLANEYLQKSAQAGVRLARIMSNRNVEGNLTLVERSFMELFNPDLGHDYNSFLDLCLTGENEFIQCLLIHYNVCVNSLYSVQILHKNARVCAYIGARFFMDGSIKQAKHLLSIAHKQKCFIDSYYLICILISEGNDKQAFKIVIETGSTYIISKVVGLKNKSGKLMYEIGKWLIRTNAPDIIVRKSINCISFYNSTIETIKLVIYTWSLCAKELGIYKDVAYLISRMVWKGKI